MYLSAVQLKNYRNYEDLSIELIDGINVFTGKNAQGKTNLLEAIYFSSIGRSMRTPRDKELIRWGNDRALIRAVSVGRGGKSKVEIILDKKENKRVAIGGAQVSKLGELMGVIMTVLFSPDEISIIKNSPGDRRRFIDIAICQLSKAYFYLLGRYNKTLAQRNKLLKSGADGGTLDVWDLQLATAGAKVIKTRRGFIARMNNLVKKNHEFLTSGQEELSLEYENVDGTGEEEIYNNFLAKLKADRERDLYNGFTHSGPQTDDFATMIGDVDARKYGSQGQQRTVALSLKLAQLDLFYEETGEYPILLLDDVFSELDENRQRKLIEKLKDHQTVITCTHLEEKFAPFFSSAKIFTVENGNITEN
ncbi:MAG: DNA replication/repair protein RecF [Clostridia bacterium]|nr:DNA replication/repair protein RecF [Clostridia bacterium]